MRSRVLAQAAVLGVVLGAAWMRMGHVPALEAAKPKQDPGARWSRGALRLDRVSAGDLLALEGGRGAAFRLVVLDPVISSRARGASAPVNRLLGPLLATPCKVELKLAPKGQAGNPSFVKCGNVEGTKGKAPAQRPSVIISPLEAAVGAQGVSIAFDEVASPLATVDHLRLNLDLKWQQTGTWVQLSLPVKRLTTRLPSEVVHGLVAAFEDGSAGRPEATWTLVGRGKGAQVVGQGWLYVLSEDGGTRRVQFHSEGRQLLAGRPTKPASDGAAGDKPRGGAQPDKRAKDRSRKKARRDTRTTKKRRADRTDRLLALLDIGGPFVSAKDYDRALDRFADALEAIIDQGKKVHPVRLERGLLRFIVAHQLSANVEWLTKRTINRQSRIRPRKPIYRHVLYSGGRHGHGYFAKLLPSDDKPIQSRDPDLWLKRWGQHGAYEYSLSLKGRYFDLFALLEDADPEKQRWPQATRRQDDDLGVLRWRGD